MSRLGDLETGILSRLATATIGGAPAFATIEGASGGPRPALRAALRRERMPAAYVAFIEEPEAPETRDVARGARFAVLVADRSLRLPSDPRLGDDDAPGAFALMAAARAQLDDWSPSSGIRLVPIHEKFVDADDRVAIYEILYRVWPIAEEVAEAPTFGGSAIAGATSEMHVEVGDFRIITIVTKTADGGVDQSFEVAARPIVWRGTLRAASHAALSSIEAAIETSIADLDEGTVADGNGRTFDGCAIERYERDGARRVDGTTVIQPAAIHFNQLNPAG